MNISTLKNWITLKEPKAQKMAVNLGLLKGSSDYTRFIILGRSRTGSNFLRGLINDHPLVISAGEIFRNEDRIDWDSPYYETNPQVLEAYQHTPVDFLRQIVFPKFPRKFKAVGFKLFYYHAQNPPFRQIWEDLQKQKNIHILHIKRRNMLETHISRQKASQSEMWVNTSGQSERQEAVHVDVQACLKDFEQTRAWEAWADDFFGEHPLMQIYYEDLAQDYELILKQVQQFLQLNYFPVHPRTFKQSSLPLSLAISNFVELQSFFRDTPYSEFFVEDH